MFWWLIPALFTIIFGWIVIFLIWFIYWEINNYANIFVDVPFMADIATIWFVMSCLWVIVTLLNIFGLVLLFIWEPYI